MKIAGKTDIGRLRETNQDAFRIAVLSDGIGFALVCDGMGGVKGGDQASTAAKRIITSVIRENIKPGMLDDELHDLLLRAIFEANQHIYETAQQQPQYAGMGTTALAAIITPACVYIGHVGDSRLYQLHGGQFYQVTRDHSRVQEMIDLGTITPEEARLRPDRNIITRAVGIAADVDVDLLDLQLSPGDRLLLCTDGLSGLCPDREIGKILGTHPIEEVAEQLISAANNRGGYDNITVVVIEN